MSKISDINDYLVTKLETLFTAKKQLFNPYTLELNNELFLNDGFGVGYGAQSLVGSTGRCIIMRQDFLIPLTKRFYALESDAGKRQDFEKELMEEVMTLIKNIELDVTLGGYASKSAFNSSPGIQQVFTESQQYISVSLTFNAEFTENL